MRALLRAPVGAVVIPIPLSLSHLIRCRQEKETVLNPFLLLPRGRRVVVEKEKMEIKKESQAADQQQSLH
jgi:hypothetical protein